MDDTAGARLSSNPCSLGASMWAWQPGKAAIKVGEKERSESSSSTSKCANQFEEKAVCGRVEQQLDPNINTGVHSEDT